MMTMSMALVTTLAVVVVLVATVVFIGWRIGMEARATVGMVGVILRVLVRRPRDEAKGRYTGVWFPTHVGALVGERGAERMTRMLRHGGHLPEGNVRAVAVKDTKTGAIKDGVKGEKALVEVEFEGGRAPSRLFFVKFQIRDGLPMKVVMNVQRNCQCEAFFYNQVVAELPALQGDGGAFVVSPKSYFCDHDPVTGAFCLVIDVIHFGEGSIAPPLHRVRDPNVLSNVLRMVRAGAEINARMWWGSSPLIETAPRAQDTRAELWALSQLMAHVKGLHHTVAHKLSGRKGVNPEWMTWRAPSGLAGRLSELVADMPAIMRSLNADDSLCAYGHNDVVFDNCWFFDDSGGAEGDQGGGGVGLYDWQQACVNNIGQEWAWNLQFLEPRFLREHESTIISVILDTYAGAGIKGVSQEAFLRAYCLGTAQMFVFSGSGLQVVMKILDKRGIFRSLVPNDPRCGEYGADHKLLGAEISRRGFTNCCEIMERHGFLDLWQQWKKTKAGSSSQARVPLSVGKG